jgi:hypothetical protein
MKLLDSVRQHLPWFLRRGHHCEHLLAATEPPGTPGNSCEECVRLGDTWYHLRQCLSCGAVRCCDQSKNKHATAHFHASGHPVVRSAQPGEFWQWCYVDELMAR